MGLDQLDKKKLLEDKASEFSSIQYEPIDKTLITGFEQWVKEYFNVKDDLKDFRRRNEGYGIELVSENADRGYVFVGPLQVERNFEKRLERSLEHYTKGLNLNIRIIKKFVHYPEELAGFSWKRD